MSEPHEGNSESALAAIRLVLDKLVAREHAPVEFAEHFYRQKYGVDMPPLTSEEVVAARTALEVLRDGK